MLTFIATFVLAQYLQSHVDQFLLYLHHRNYSLDFRASFLKSGFHHFADGLLSTGACAACPGAQATINEVVETALRDACPEIKGVIPVAQVDQELIDIALKILRRDRIGHDG